MSSPAITSGASVIYGGNSPGGVEDRPQLRYEVSDKDGVSKVTAVLSRKIHCLAVHAEAIKQSMAFPGQIVEVDGVSYGAGWVLSGCNVVPLGDSAEVQAEARREGVTPFEWGLPPRLSMEMADGVATMYYTTEAGTKVQMLQWDSGTGEDRYGWKVDYVSRGMLRWANPHVGWESAQTFDVYISYEGIRQFAIPFDGTRFATPSSFSEETKIVYSGPMSAAESEAEGAEEEAVAAIVAALEAEAAANRETSPMDVYGKSKYIVGVNGDSATAERVPLAIGWWGFKVSVQVVYVEYAVAELVEQQNLGVHWESVVDRVSSSATYLHVFYRLRYAATILFSIDITSVEAAT